LHGLGNIHTHPKKIIRNSRRREVSKANNFFRESIELNWNFQQGRGGFHTENTLLGWGGKRYGYFTI